MPLWKGRNIGLEGWVGHRSSVAAPPPPPDMHTSVDTCVMSSEATRHDTHTSIHTCVSYDTHLAGEEHGLELQRGEAPILHHVARQAELVGGLRGADGGQGRVLDHGVRVRAARLFRGEGVG